MGTTGTTWAKFRRALRRFASAREGNVAVIFAFALLPVIASVGAAVDYSRANSVKADLQAALDSTALMLSKEAAADTENELQTHALAYFKAAFNRPGHRELSPSAPVTAAPTVRRWC